MASIFQSNRIREYQGVTDGEPLVYGIGTNDPRAQALALQAHEFVYVHFLTEDQRRAVTPKWIGKVIKGMVNAGKEGWLVTLLDHLRTLEPNMPKEAGNGSDSTHTAPSYTIK